MLILTRKPRERLIINDDITVEVIGYYGDKVRLAITAPDNVTIDHPKKTPEPSVNIIYKTVNKLLGR